MKGTALSYWLAFAALLAAVYGGFKVYKVQQWRQEGGIVVTQNLPPLENFELTERSGQTFRSDDMKGKVWVATFFFSTCQGSCSRLNSHIKYLSSLDEIRDVTWVSISVDPVNDTLPVLREYADRFQADADRWLFCRGDLAYVKRLADDFLKVGGVSYQGHNDYGVIVDKNGKVAGMFNAASTKESEKAIEILKKCLEAEYIPSKSNNAKPVVKTEGRPSDAAMPRSAEAA
jgi:cytochrome oxidase Cu insertion factor (SCO1/SenC/PrrC family)